MGVDQAPADDASVPSPSKPDTRCARLLYTTVPDTGELAVANHLLFDLVSRRYTATLVWSPSVRVLLLYIVRSSSCAHFRGLNLHDYCSMYSSTLESTRTRTRVLCAEAPTRIGSPCRQSTSIGGRSYDMVTGRASCVYSNTPCRRQKLPHTSLAMREPHRTNCAIYCITATDVICYYCNRLGG